MNATVKDMYIGTYFRWKDEKEEEKGENGWRKEENTNRRKGKQRGWGEWKIRDFEKDVE